MSTMLEAVTVATTELLVVSMTETREPSLAASTPSQRQDSTALARSSAPPRLDLRNVCDGALTGRNPASHPTD
jgi:hypothetical protein